ncbi:MAG: hypothetical protein F6K62_25300 [Sphaerospermopsis sp. SIO1G2]|nr:hypothetical protein [Sphaerospermopsis sp. SIO1G2]
MTAKDKEEEDDRRRQKAKPVGGGGPAEARKTKQQSLKTIFARQRWMAQQSRSILDTRREARSPIKKKKGRTNASSGSEEDINNQEPAGGSRSTESKEQDESQLMPPPKAVPPQRLGQASTKEVAPPHNKTKANAKSSEASADLFASQDILQENDDNEAEDDGEINNNKEDYPSSEVGKRSNSAAHDTSGGDSGLGEPSASDTGPSKQRNPLAKNRTTNLGKGKAPAQRRKVYSSPDTDGEDDSYDEEEQPVKTVKRRRTQVLIPYYLRCKVKSLYHMQETAGLGVCAALAASHSPDTKTIIQHAYR